MRETEAILFGTNRQHLKVWFGAGQYPKWINAIDSITNDISQLPKYYEKLYIEPEREPWANIKGKDFFVQTRFIPEVMVTVLMLYRDHLNLLTSNTTKGTPEKTGLIEEPKRDLRIEKAKKIFELLKGDNPIGQKILSGEDYSKLEQAFEYLIKNEATSKEVSPISQVFIPMGHIRYLFYLIHKELYSTKRIKECFIDFLHSTFTCFEGPTPKTTRTKFSVKPPSWDQDMNGNIGK